MSDTNKILNDIRAYLRISGAVASRTVATRLIDSHEKATVFQRLDGNTPQSKIEQTEGIPNQTISRWLGDFVKEGLVTPPNEYSKNYRALFTLQELGIDLSKLPKKTKASSPQPSSQLSKAEEVGGSS